MMAGLLKTGRIYVAPPNRHLLLEGNRVSRKQCLADCRSDAPLGGGLLRFSRRRGRSDRALGDVDAPAGGITVVQEPRKTPPFRKCRLPPLDERRPIVLWD
jgi:hypothetical protein